MREILKFFIHPAFTVTGVLILAFDWSSDMEQIPCVHCGKFFIPRNRKQNYCAEPECQRARDEPCPARSKVRMVRCSSQGGRVYYKLKGSKRIKEAKEIKSQILTGKGLKEFELNGDFLKKMIQK